LLKLSMFLKHIFSRRRYRRYIRTRSRVVNELFEHFGKIAIKYDGTISAEHGIGVHKKEMLKMVMEAKGSASALRIYKEIRRIFDPYSVFSPGKIVE